MGEVLTAVVHAGKTGFGPERQKKSSAGSGGSAQHYIRFRNRSCFHSMQRHLQIWRGCLKHCHARRSGRGDEALSKVVVQVRQDICARCKNEEQCWRRTIFPCCQAWYELWLILQGEKEEPLEEILGFCRKPGTGAKSCDVCLWTGASAASDGQPVDGAEDGQPVSRSGRRQSCLSGRQRD